MLAMMLTSTATVLVAGIVSIIYEVTAFRSASVRDLSAQAQIIGENCAAALEFDNPETADATIASLRARTDIEAACVYRKNGSVLASYPHQTATALTTFPKVESEGYRIERGHLALFHQISRKGEVVGTVYLRSNLEEHYARLGAGITVALAAMVAAWALALALAARLRRQIANPIMELANMTERVRNQQDYSLRSKKHGEDEIGVLTAGFNRMLEDIQDRDAKLHQAYLELQSSEDALRKLSVRLLQSRDEERRRIAGELHDATGQKLAAAAMYLSQIDRSSSTLTQTEQEALTKSLALLDESSQEIRTLSYLLHPPLLDERGLLSALPWYVEGFSMRSEIKVVCDIAPNVGRLPQEIEMALFRIVQEGLSNIHRHSGSPEAVIGLQKKGQAIRLEVRDSGKGFPAKRPDGLPVVMGVGITSMRERVRQLHGQMEVHSDSQGTTICVTLPLNGAET